VDCSKLSKISFVIFITETSFDAARAVTFLGRPVIKEISPNMDPMPNSLTIISSESVSDMRPSATLSVIDL